MSKKVLKIALVQMQCEKGAVRKNLRKMETYIELASNSGADIIAFPELCIPGYIFPLRMPQHVFSATTSDVMRRYYRMTKGRNIVAIAGFAEKFGKNSRYISQAVAANGKLMGVYRKRNINEEEKKGFIGSDASPVFLTRSKIRFGISICADIDKEETFKAAAQQGAKIIFHCSAPDLWKRRRNTEQWFKGYEWWKSRCQTYLSQYARKYKVFIASTTQCGRTVDEDFPGGMYVFNPQGECIAQSNDYRESSLIATLSLTA